MQIMHKLEKKATGGFICSKIKVAIALHILASGSYWDLGLIFNVYSTSVIKILHEVYLWLNRDEIANFNACSYVHDNKRMVQVAHGFKWDPNHFFKGCIGALDGWLVKINRPTESDGIAQPDDCFARKGSHALTVQVIVDRYKRVIYRSVKARGGEHDFTAFKKSDFCKVLAERDDFCKALAERDHFLVDNGYYLIADSTYQVRSVVIGPYDNTIHNTKKDNFDYFHSTSRIVVECAFGEIDLRWGILWWPLKYTLKQIIEVINACLRLQNYIVSYALSNEYVEDNIIRTRERQNFIDDVHAFYRVVSS